MSVFDAAMFPDTVTLSPRTWPPGTSGGAVPVEGTTVSLAANIQFFTDRDSQEFSEERIRSIMTGSASFRTNPGIVANDMILWAGAASGPISPPLKIQCLTPTVPVFHGELFRCAIKLVT